MIFLITQFCHQIVNADCPPSSVCSVKKNTEFWLSVSEHEHDADYKSSGCYSRKKKKRTHSSIVLIYSSHLRLHVESYEKAARVWSWNTRSFCMWRLISRRQGSHLIPLNIQFAENYTQRFVQASRGLDVRNEMLNLLHRITAYIFITETSLIKSWFIVHYADYTRGRNSDAARIQILYSRKSINTTLWKNCTENVT